MDNGRDLMAGLQSRSWIGVDFSSSFVSMNAPDTQIKVSLTSWRLDECCANYPVAEAFGYEMMAPVARSAACSLFSLHSCGCWQGKLIFIYLAPESCLLCKVVQLKNTQTLILRNVVKLKVKQMFCSVGKIRHRANNMLGPLFKFCL